MQVGHNALGSGQVVSQGALLVDQAIASGDVFKQDGWRFISPAFEKNTLHLLGLLSDGGVHSRYDQLLGLINGVRAIFILSVFLHSLLFVFYITVFYISNTWPFILQSFTFQTFLTSFYFN